MSVLGQTEPKEVFRFFEEISQIPRGTYNTKAVSDYCVNFAKERGLEVIQDEWNNVKMCIRDRPIYYYVLSVE